MRSHSSVDLHAPPSSSGGETKAGSELIVKFVHRYNADAHRFVAGRGLAPTLIHYGPLGGCYATDMHMVVMDYVVEKTLYELYDNNGVLLGGSKSAIGDALVQLNDGGFIFPDLSGVNVMITATNDGDMRGLRFMDFDWVCEKDQGMRYPLHLSQPLREKAAAKDSDVITPERQESVFENLLFLSSSHVLSVCYHLAFGPSNHCTWTKL
ncbi:hypothetical protein PM082_012165 [Marasmius tenuissimus]|nr:hypothetical protein PM082_012165 [Marasmius tenuissimus]